MTKIFRRAHRHNSRSHMFSIVCLVVLIFKATAIPLSQEFKGISITKGSPSITGQLKTGDVAVNATASHGISLDFRANASDPSFGANDWKFRQKWQKVEFVAVCVDAGLSIIFTAGCIFFIIRRCRCRLRKPRPTTSTQHFKHPRRCSNNQPPGRDTISLPMETLSGFSQSHSMHEPTGTPSNSHQTSARENARPDTRKVRFNFESGWKSETASENEKLVASDSCDYEVPNHHQNQSYDFPPPPMPFTMPPKPKVPPKPILKSTPPKGYENNGFEL